MLQNSGNVDNSTPLIDLKVKNYNLGPGPSSIDADAADTDTWQTIAKMSEQEDVFNIFCRSRKNDEWKAFMELMMGKNTTMTTIPNVIVTKLI